MNIPIGKIKFTLSDEISDIVVGHCAQFRKAQGSAFATNANVKEKSFKFISGENNLFAFKYSNEQTKYFCKTCGSPIMSKNLNHPDNIRIRLGTIESDITERPEAHMCVSSKANWEEICDSLPQYAEYKTNTGHCE